MDTKYSFDKTTTIKDVDFGAKCIKWLVSSQPVNFRKGLVNCSPSVCSARFMMGNLLYIVLKESCFYL